MSSIKVATRTWTQPLVTPPVLLLLIFVEVFGCVAVPLSRAEHVSPDFKVPRRFVFFHLSG